VFYLAGHIEAWGRGIEKIMNACRDDGIYPPQYDVSSTDITVEFTAPEERLIRTNGRVTVNVTDGVTVKVTVNERAVIALLSENNRYTMIELAGKLSLSRKTIADCIKSLKGKGLLERIGSDKNGRWHVIGDTDKYEPSSK
jgi:ATP-dependent DNA helicase RecG